MKGMAWTVAAVVAGALAMGACDTHHEIVIKQDKPMEINLNVKADVNLVIHDARQDMEQITGEKPKQTVNPEDIGLPAAPGAKPGASTDGGGRMGLPAGEGVVTLADFGRAGAVQVATEDELKKNMAGRDKELRAMWNAGSVGEAHTGLVAAKAGLTADQQTLVTAENGDRAQLYKIQAAAKGSTEAEVAQAYYLSRLGYAQKGCWYEKVDKTTKQWVWAQWGM